MSEPSSSGYTLSKLLAAPKGNLHHLPGEAFLLTVFWQAPSLEAASTLLEGLRQCAAATHRDTPCVPTYFFRLANNNADLCPPPARTAAEHPHLKDVHRKLRMGVPAPAVRAHLTKLGLDPDLLDLDPSAELPPALQTKPVAVEFTEVYLDERAFMEHAGSRDYLDGYGIVMNPQLMYTTPCTVRLGTPSEQIRTGILEPMLKEEVAPLPAGCAIWRRPASPTAQDEAMFLSLDMPAPEGFSGEDAAAAVTAALPAAFLEHCTTCVAFAHPQREQTVRLLCVLPLLPPTSVLAGVAELRPCRGEAHMPGACEAAVKAARTALATATLGFVTVNASDCVGYVLHAQAHDVQPAESVEAA